MTQPQPAPVRPRAVSPETGETVLLEDAVEMLLDGGRTTAIEIVGPPGAGKNTAVAHLAAVFGEREEILFLDDLREMDAREDIRHKLVVFTVGRGHRSRSASALRLASWTDDEVIEYLLARHPGRCQSVMQRLRNDDYRRRLLGNPELWRAVLDELAAADDLPDVRAALRSAFQRLTPEERILRAAREACLLERLAPGDAGDRWLREFAAAYPSHEALKLLRHRAVSLLLAADELAQRSSHQLAKHLTSTWPPELIAEYSQRIAGDEATIERLKRLLNGSYGARHATAASLLTAAKATWRPTSDMQLSGALLNGVDWSGAELTGADLQEAHLSRARLAEANLSGANMRCCRLRRSNLRGADMEDAILVDADLSEADLTGVCGPWAQFRRARLTGAILRDADLPDAHMAWTDLRRATFQGSDLTNANFTEAQIEDTDFRNCDLRGALLNRLVLRLSRFDGALLCSADLRYCDLEYMQLPGAQLEGASLADALLTGAQLPGANLQRAKLHRAGLADVDLEGADLRDADFRDCAFHLGSSRSGRVGSPYPCHGTRTGFYTDSYDDRYHKAPEEIRKANLRGADLRGAVVAGVDFYLVDLRDALYDSQQEAHFRRCDAILGVVSGEA